MTLLWVIEFEYSTRLHHGAVMRFISYSKELRALGHRVFFAVLLEEADPGPSRLWFQELVQGGVISGFFELEYAPPKRALSLSAWLFHPALSNPLLRRYRKAAVAAIKTILREEQVDAVINTKRKLFFLAGALAGARYKILDFGDCEALYFSREIKSLLAERRWAEALRRMLRLLRSAISERYYAQQCSAAMVVSPVDKKALDRVSSLPEKSHILLNGVIIPPPNAVPKIGNRLIFSGNMNFPPNQSAALWFIEKVLPLVREQFPDTQLVLAGANPPPELLALESETIHVTGFVEDMNREIACSAVYVAPLISGGGFKNKVVEALANRTYVVATPMAVEFLAPEARERVAVADSPVEMAAHIVRILRDPAACQEQLEYLYNYVCTNLSWAGQTAVLLKIIETV